MSVILKWTPYGLRRGLFYPTVTLSFLTLRVNRLRFAECISAARRVESAEWVRTARLCINCG
jgi:hypothetical protein